MDYEKKYKEALERARAKYAMKDQPIHQDLVDLFPELKESGSEKMIQYFKDLAPFDNAEELYEKYGFSHKDAIAWLEKQGKQKPNCCDGQKPKTHNGSDNPYDMSYPDAEGYISKRGFDVPWCDCDVFVDNRYITQTVGNILRWADDNPKQKSTTLELKAGCWYLCIEDYQPRADYTDFYQGEKYHCEKDGVMGKWCIKHPEKYFRECKNPAEWSEEDEQLYNDLSDTYFYNDEDYPEETYKLMLKRVLDWMTKRAKSLRPQSTWKPSDEQMEALETAVSSLQSTALESLYNKLKKL